MDKILIFFILIIISTNVYSQKNTDRDSVKYYSKLAISSVNIEPAKSIRYIDKALVFAEKMKDSEIISDILIKKGHIQYYADLVNESFATLKKASLQDYTKKSPYFQARIKIIRSDNYFRIGLDSLSLQESKEVLKILNYNTKNVKEQTMLLRSIGRLVVYYYDHKKQSTYEKYFADYERLLKKLNRNDFIPEFETFYFNKSTLLLEKKSYDSAFHYLKLGEQFQHSLGSKTLPSHYYYAFGEYYNGIQNYEQALNYYTLFINKMEKNHTKYKESFLDDYILDAYIKAANISSKLGNKQQQIIYLNKYSKLTQEFIKKKDDVAINYALKRLAQEKEETYQNKIIIGSILLFGLVIIISWYIKSLQKKRTLLKTENEKQKSEKEKMISILEKERQLSKQKTKDNIEDLLELAKKSDPSFYVKFQNLFPDFQKQLIEISPELTPGELELLAYIFLNFSSKEIADFTFKSVRTIQNRKYALRKKLKVDTHLDFHVWIKEATTN